jgi:hypothetical protein
MRILIAGASGAIGRRLVRGLFSIPEVIQQSSCFALAYLLEEEATALWREPTVKLQ